WRSSSRRAASRAASCPSAWRWWRTSPARRAGRSSSARCASSCAPRFLARPRERGRWGAPLDGAPPGCLLKAAMPADYRTQVVIVTGASSGIGRVTARAFAERGAVVVGVARREPLLQQLVTECRRRSPASAAKVAPPREAMYAASKAAMNAFSEGLWNDLAGSNIHVAIVNPGPIDTEIWFKEDEPVWYDGKKYPPEIVTDAIFEAIEKR